MTIKFTRSPSRTKEPAVCHVFPWPPVPFVPTSYPDLQGYTAFKIKKYDGTWFEAQTLLDIPWMGNGPFWERMSAHPGYYLNITVLAPPPPGTAYMGVTYQVIGAHAWSTGWYVMQYTPGQYWKSGERYIYAFPPGNKAWMHLHI